MIITFYGTEKSKNSAPQILAACAFEAAYVYTRKTLVLQFYSKYPVEEFLLGKQQTNERFGFVDNDETGIETLLRKSRTGGLNKEDFGIYTKPIFTGSGSKNAFDVAPVPKLADFKDELLDKEMDIKNLLEVARDVYDNIFILADGKDEQTINMLLKYTDKKVACIPQGNTQTVYGSDEKTVYVVDNYDARSTFHLKKLKKLYNTTHLYPVYYNVNFKDACLNNSILKFMHENNSKDDVENGVFISSIRNLTAYLINESAKDVEIAGIKSFDLKQIPKVEYRFEKMVIEPEQVKIEVKKKHFWSKKKPIVTVSQNEVKGTEDLLTHTEDIAEEVSQIMKENEFSIDSKESVEPVNTSEEKVEVIPEESNGEVTGKTTNQKNSTRKRRNKNTSGAHKR